MRQHVVHLAGDPVALGQGGGTGLLRIARALGQQLLGLSRAGLVLATASAAQDRGGDREQPFDDDRVAECRRPAP